MDVGRRFLRTRRLPPVDQMMYVGICFAVALLADFGALWVGDEAFHALTVLNTVAIAFAAWTLGFPRTWFIVPFPIFTDMLLFSARGDPLIGLLTTEIDLLLLDLLLPIGAAVVADALAATLKERDLLAAANRRFLRLGENSPVLVWIAPPDLARFHYLSPAVERIFGRPASWFKDPENRFSLVHPDDRDRVRAASMRLREGFSYEIEYRILRPDGEVRWVRARNFAIRDTVGAIVELCGLTEDVTSGKIAADALAASEARFRRFADNVEECIAIFAADGTFHYLSPAYERLTGRTREALLAAPETWIDQVHLEDRPRVLAAAAALPTMGSYDLEYRMNRADGETRTVRERCYAVRDDQGKVIEFAALAADVTGLHQAAETLRRNEALATVGGLVAGVAHEINNPLTYVRVSAEIIQEDLDVATASDIPPALRERLRESRALSESLLKGIHRVEEVTQGLKRVARPGSAPRSSDALAPLIDSVVSIARARISPNIEITTAIDAPDAKVDGPRVTQVLLNVVLNAGDAIGDEAGHVRVRASLVGEKVRIDVSDDGPGIPDAVRARMFTPFFTTKPNGTGLGLSVSRELLVEINGTLELLPTGGPGSTFRLEVPLDILCSANEKQPRTSLTRATKVVP